MTRLQRLRYYFMDLPLWSCGYRSSSLRKRLYKTFEPEIPLIKNGYEALSGYMSKPVTESEVDDVLQKAFWVKIVRESDAYTSLRMSGKNLHRYFRFAGIDHLESLRKEKRPIIILTGHIGSFFIPSIAFHHLGFEVYPIARTVDTSPATPRLTRLYLTLNYRLPERRFPARYILTDFAGKIDRTIVSVSKNNGMFWVAVDFPRRVYQYRHLPVTLFGQRATLPSGIIRWGIKKNAIFLTGWNSVETDGERFYRLLSIDRPIEGGTDPQAVLQEYADRLSEFVIRKPWQWMALPSIQHYTESYSENAEPKTTQPGMPGPPGSLAEVSDRAPK
jgi:lauroyl/myristoyl acyltransferase